MIELINASPGLAAVATIAIIGIILLLFIVRRFRSIDSRLRENAKQLSSRIKDDNQHAADTLQRVFEMTLSSAEGHEARIAKLADTVSSLTVSVDRQFTQMRDSLEQRQDRLTKSVAEQLGSLQSSNEKRLDQMRETVDQRLQSTLEKRLGESFNQVVKQLESVHQGLGEMQKLAGDVGSLQKVISGVRSRGAWGEMQLRALLEQALTPSQYLENTPVVPGSAERVEFAIVLPGKGDESQVLLPIDSKFPMADYERLVDAAELSDKKAVDEAARGFEKALLDQAKKISSKYIQIPYTTDFAILFLPVESLYAEALRRPGLFTEIQTKYRVILSGPTTLSSLLSSLQMGFRTLAVEKRSLEIGRLLRSVKVEFEKFGDVLSRTKDKLDQASKELEKTDIRTRKINRQLQDVEDIEIGIGEPLE